MLSQRFVKRSSVVVVLLAFGFVLTGCGGGAKITKENAAKVQSGMTEQQVTDILGAPSKKNEVDPAAVGGIPGVGAVPGLGALKSTVLIWEDGPKTITVVLQGGKVITSESKGF